jgi:hypothetical protein
LRFAGPTGLGETVGDPGGEYGEKRLAQTVEHLDR